MWVDLRSLWERNVDVRLTGVSATFATGTPGVANDTPLVGQAATSAAGTLAPSTDTALTGAAIVSTTGTFTNSDFEALTGQAATFSAGTLVPSTDTALTGIGVTSAAGTLSPNTDIALGGASATFAAGTVTADISTGDVNQALTGLAAAFATGTITASASSTQETFSGGFETVAERHILARRIRKEREQERAREAREEAESDPVQAELASLLHENLAQQAEHDDLQRLKDLVARQKLDRSLPERVQRAFELAQLEQSFSRLQALQREYARMLEEEEMAILLILANLD